MPLVRIDSLQQFAAVNLRSDPGAIAGPRTAPNCAQISIIGNLESGKVGHMVLGGRYAGAFSGSVAQANGILTALTTGAAWTTLAGFLATTNFINAIQIRDVNTPNNAIIQSTGPGQAGTSASPSQPNEVAAVITLRTAFTGQANRGRMYVWGWATNALSAGNVISAAAVTALQAWANTIPAALSAQGYTWVVIQPARQPYVGSTGRQHPARAATSTPVISALVRDNHWDTQRRRGLK